MSRIYKAFLENEAAIRRVFARYFRSTADVEELTQETFVRCFAAETKNDIINPKSFLFRAAKNLALSERKQKYRNTTDFFEDSGGSEVILDENSVSAEVRLDNRRKLAVLAEALASLPEEYRRALLMRKLENLKLAQIATRTNVSVRTAQKRVAVALDMCDAFLRKKGYEPIEFGGVSHISTSPIKSEGSKQTAHPASQDKSERNG